MDNQLGRNLQHLREAHKLTLDAVGNIIHCARSTVKGYENGSREPDYQVLQQLSTYFGVTVDELLHADLTGVEGVQIDLNSPSNRLIERLNLVLPLYSSEEALKSNSFKRGFELSKNLLDSFSKGEALPGNQIVRIFESYLSALDESDAPEIAANLMWSVFIWWTQIIDTNQALSLQNKMLSKKLSYKDFMKLKIEEDEAIKQKRIGFVRDFEEIITFALKILNTEQEWSDLADYYRALRHVLYMVDTELTNEMNAVIGRQMMVSFATLGNKQAFEFYKACLSEQ